jgi:hypothetical protein
MNAWEIKTNRTLIKKGVIKIYPVESTFYPDESDTDQSYPMKTQILATY